MNIFERLPSPPLAQAPFLQCFVTGLTTNHRLHTDLLCGICFLFTQPSLLFYVFQTIRVVSCRKCLLRAYYTLQPFGLSFRESKGRIMGNNIVYLFPKPFSNNIANLFSITPKIS